MILLLLLRPEGRSKVWKKRNIRTPVNISISPLFKEDKYKFKNNSQYIINKTNNMLIIE